MIEKLTLSVEKSVVKKAKEYAESTGNTLSGLIENYLKSFSSDPVRHKKDDLSPIVKSLKGSFKSHHGFNYKQELAAELSKKYEE